MKNEPHPHVTPSHSFRLAPPPPPTLHIRMSHSSHSSISEAAFTIITTTHYTNTPSSQLHNIPLPVIPPAPITPPPPVPASLPSVLPEGKPSLPDDVIEVPSFFSVPIMAQRFLPTLISYRRDVVKVDEKEVVTRPDGESQILLIPERRLFVGDWIKVPRKGLGHIIEQKVMCGKYILLRIRIHDTPPFAHEDYLLEYHAWINASDLVLSWHDRWESLKEHVRRRNFVLYESSYV